MRTKNTLLWVAQVLLAALFLFAGVMKLVTPVEAMNAQSPLPLPGPFLRFIGVVEVLGALGLILPSLTRIKPLLTPLAAAGLVVVMLGATILTLVTGGPAAAVVPTVVGVLSGLVAWGRTRIAARA